MKNCDHSPAPITELLTDPVCPKRRPSADFDVGKIGPFKHA